MSTDTTQSAAAWQEPLPLTDGRFTQIPRALLVMLTPREYQLAAALLGYRWYDDSPIIPSVKRLAAEMDCSPRTVQRAAARLVDLGVFVVEPRYRGDEGQTSNEYRLGPVLLAMMPRASAAGAADSQPRRHPPVTPRAAERYSGNQTNQKRRPERPDICADRDYFATREGSLRRT